jgi:hypothetical protein
MVDLDWKSNIVSPDMPSKSPKLSNKLQVSLPFSFRAAEISPASATASSAYDNYLRLPELRKLWSYEEFPSWKNESFFETGLASFGDFVPVRLDGVVGPKAVREPARVEAEARVARDIPDRAYR